MDSCFAYWDRIRNQGERMKNKEDLTALDGDSAAPDGVSAAMYGGSVGLDGERAAPGGDLAAPGGDLAAPGGGLAAPGGDFAAPGGDLDMDARDALPLPSRIPLLASIDALYPPETLDAQRLRYGKLKKEFFRHFPDRSTGPDGQHRLNGHFPDRQALSGLLFFSAPGRTELCGNHTDHNNGKVLAAAISLDTIGAAAPRSDTLVRVVSEGFGAFEVDLADLSVRPKEKGGSAAIVRGMAAGLAKLAARRGSMHQIQGFDAYIESKILPGSGLSSSAAFEVLIGGILGVFSGIEISPMEIARIGQFAENEYFGKPCGLMDQMACALGNTAALDFGDTDRVKVNLLRFDPSEYGLALVIVATGGSHADLTEDYAAIPGEMKAVAAVLGASTLAGTSIAGLLAQAGEIRKSCGDRAFLRAWHFVKETERPAALRKAIMKADIGAYLATICDSGDSSAKYLQNLYSPKNPSEQGLLIALAATEDFLAGNGACRVHGGGFAGTIQTYLPGAKLPAYKALMESLFGPFCVFPLRIRPFGVVCIENPQGAFDER